MPPTPESASMINMIWSDIRPFCYSRLFSENRRDKIIKVSGAAGLSCQPSGGAVWRDFSTKSRVAVPRGILCSARIVRRLFIHLVDKAVLLGFLGGHEEVALDIFFYFLF